MSDVDLNELRWAIKLAQDNKSGTLWMGIQYAEGLLSMAEASADMLAALKQIESEMNAGFGSSFGETREQIRRAVAAAQLWKERWEAERRDHEATIKHCDNMLNEPAR